MQTTRGEPDQIRFSSVNNGLFIRSVPDKWFKSSVFLLEIGSENAVADGIFYLLSAPESAAVQLVAWVYLTVVGCAEYMYKFFLTLALKDVPQQECGVQAGKPQLLAHLAVECVRYLLAIVDVTSYSGVPFARLYIFPHRALLEVDASLGIEQMQVDYGV